MIGPLARLRARWIALILGVVALVGLAAGVILIDKIGEEMIANRQADVAESADSYFESFAREEGLAPLARALDRDERTRKHEAFRYALFSRTGQLMGGARLLRFNQLPPPGSSRVPISAEGKTSTYQVSVHRLESGAVLVVYEDLSERTAFREALALAGAVALLSALAAVVAASLWLNNMILRRVQAIEATASNIAAGDLSARVPTRANGDVFDRLGGAINQMLDRIEELLTGLRTVTDSLSHDLRSPLTRMKSALATALEPEANEAARTEAIGQAFDQADQALATTSALLEIARAETGLSRDAFQPVDLRALVAEVGELFGPVLEDAGQEMEVREPESPLVIMGHELLIRQALGNVLFNAARYAGRGARVCIAAEPAGHDARIVVTDTGPGIPESERGRVQERFVRLDAARTTPGSGLGLAIAAACAKLHHGALVLGDNHPGLRVDLTLGGRIDRAAAANTEQPAADAA